MISPIETKAFLVVMVCFYVGLVFFCFVIEVMGMIGVMNIKAAI